MIKIKICSLEKLEKKNYIVTWINKIKDEVIVFKNDKKIYVKSSICPHFGGPIAYNQNNKNLYCSWHGLKFSVDGKCINQNTFKTCLSNYNFELKNNYIYIKK
jgi:nitrite reductase/ring-hydroxylating ferredoxin subunit